MFNINCFYIYINKKLSSLKRIGTRVLLPALRPKLKVYTFQLYKMITKSIRIYFINQFRDGFISNFYRFSLTTDSLLKSHLTTSPINTFLYYLLLSAIRSEPVSVLISRPFIAVPRPLESSAINLKSL